MVRHALTALRRGIERITGVARLELQNKALTDLLAVTFHRTGQTLEELAVLQRQLNLLQSQLTLPPASLWKDGVTQTAQPAPGVVFPTSRACRQGDMDQPCYVYWSERIGHAPRYHRKVWEFVFILQALSERGVLREGARGLGFGVGEEPLTAYFASLGCHILGTDMTPEAAADAGWTATAQHAAGKAALRKSWLCDDAVFDANVEFRAADMNAIPADLEDFDFCWSACALEHLGSIEKGLRFIEASLNTLRPGGLAVHTTELNLSSNDATLDNAGTVLFRRRDFEALAERLTAQGHVVAPLDFEVGDQPLDRYVDVPPFRDEPHLRLALQGYVTTSFGIIVQKAG